MPGSTVPLPMFFLYILSFCISPHNRSSSSSLKVESLKLQIGSEETFWRAMETIWKCKPAVSQFHGFPFWPQPTTTTQSPIVSPDRSDGEDGNHQKDKIRKNY